MTIWGQSAGAGSVEAQVLFAGKQGLFRAAIFDSSTGPLSAHIPLLSSISLTLIGSKTAPPASTYDEPGKPFALLTQAVGCALGPGSFECLQSVPFEVSDLIIYDWIPDHKILDLAQCHQHSDGRTSERTALAAYGGPCGKLCPRAPFRANRERELPACPHPGGHKRKHLHSLWSEAL